MANNEAGAFLNITPDVLKKLDSFDEKLEKIEKHAHTAADALKNGFGKVVIDTTKLENAITSLANKMNALNSAGNVVQNIGTSMNQVSKDATKAASSLSSVAQSINKVKPDNSLAKSVEQYRSISSQIEQVSSRQKQLNDIIKSYELTMSRIQSGNGGVIQAGQQQQVQAARQEFEENNKLLSTLKQKQQEIVNTNVAYQKQIQLVEQLKTYNKELNSLPNQRSNQTLSDMRAYYSELEKSSARAAKAAEQAAIKEEKERERVTAKAIKDAERKAAADEKAAQRAAKAAAESAKAQNYQKNTTTQGALDFSKTANTLQRQITAIEYLKKARLSLNTTDANYKNTLNQINQAIAKHNQALTEAGVKSQQLATRHRNLMDTAGQLSRQLALVFSVSQIEGFISSIAKVRGEFELQQRSLQAILQNKTKADTVFNKTMALALDSPFRAQQLITYTKQLAAYRIESDKLYDTTKRLAEVSAGLGVGMDRLILAYGQVKAAAYLRGSEVRQFTEAGINMYGELQRYFQEINGEAYTTAQIVDMISKRKVTFEDVENIFKRLTDEGGLFYNMQHIQVETLSGKIGKLRDAIDQMKNSIGKENEGIFKGLIDAATVLVQNWDKIVNVGYALAGVFLMLKTQSLLTGVAMRKVFTAEFAAGGKNALKPLELLKIKFWDLQKGAIALGKSMKAAFVTNLPLLAITAIVSATYKAYDKISSYNDAISKSNEELVKARGLVADIANEYKNLETASNNAKRVQDRNNDYATDIKARRNALQKLIDLANKEGLTFEVKVSEVKEEELDAVFNGVKEQYERFLLDMAIIEKNHAENERNRDWWFFSDAINEDAEDYRKAVLDVLSQSDKLDMAIANVKANYSNLSEASKEYYNIVAAGRKEGESQIDYYSRMYNAMLQINRLNVGTNTGVPQWLKGTNTILKDVSGSFKDVGNQAKEFEKELDRVLGEVIANARENGATDIQIQARIDKYAAQQGFDDIKKDLAYQHFGINVSINQDSVDKEISWVDNYLKEFFEKKTYKINLDMTQPIDAKVPFEDFVKKGDEAAKAAKSWEEVGKRIAAIGENVKQIEADSKIANFLNSQSPILNIKSGDMVDVKLILDTISEYKKTQTDLSNALGVNPFEKKGGNAERDIWSERISVLKEMQSRYEKLNQLMGENQAIAETRSAFKGALDFTQMGEVIKPEDIIPTKKGMIDALEKLLKQIPDIPKYAAKRTGLEKEIAELKIGIQQDYLKEQLEKTKKNIEDMFNGLDLYNKMKKEGFSDDMIKSLFGDLTTTESEIQAEIEKLAGKEGELWEKAYDDMNKKLKAKQDEMFKNRIEQYKQFINNFSNKIENKQEEFADYMKIARDMLNKTGDVKAFTDQVGNIIAKYNQDIAKIETEKFKKSGTYIEMMGELSIKSADELQDLIEKLENFIAKSASNIPADTLKIYINRLNEANEQLDKVKNPFGKSFIKGIKEITELQNKYNTEKNYQNELLQKQIDLENELRDIESKRDIAKANGDDTTNFENKIVDIQKLIKDNDNSIVNSSSKLQGMSTQMGKMTQGAGAVIGIIDKIVKGIDDSIQATADLFNEIKDIASSYGADTESGGWQDLSIAMSSISEMSTNVSNSWNSFKSGDFAGAAVSAIKAVGSVIKGINAIHDAKYERKIKRQQENIKNLGKAYDELKEKMEAAWSADDLRTQTKDTVANLDQQIASYQAMIKAEQDKKDTDQARIDEWNDAIKELEKTKKEILDEERKYMGGIGGEEEYRSAAESFVQAWMDAFNETGDGLKGLEENFDDMINNLFLKQVSMRVVNKMLAPIFDIVDASVSEIQEAIDRGSDFEDILKEKIAAITDKADNILPVVNEILGGLYSSLGLGNNKKAELSSLTQSIQGVTEQTAEELAALLGSVRFFVSQQTTDISAIRALLDARYSLESEYSDSNPMLVELRAQTGYLEILSDRIDRVFAPSANSKGAGLRVFMQ